MTNPEPDPEPANDEGDVDGPDAIEQCQRALLTLIGASRVALDALEAVVADRSHLDHMVTNGRDLVGTFRSVLGCSETTGSGADASPSNP